MFNRRLKPSKNNSFLLLGARGTGKSTLLRTLLPAGETLWIDLLDQDQEARLARRPMALADQLSQLTLSKQSENIRWVVIDEVQKIPNLLDVVHKEIEKGRFYFGLTGSSARKLKRGSANLLAGRAFAYHLFPLTQAELGSAFDLSQILRWGSLPKIFSLEEQDRAEYLRSYALTYLKEEIQAEQIIRKIPPFRAFLEVAAQSAGKIINYSNIARDISSDAASVQSYFEILEDTLIGFQLKPFHQSVRKRQRKNPKFYLFDLGVQHALARTLNIPLEPRTSAYGDAFEQWLITEIYRLEHYLKKDWAFSYLRTKDDAEIDLIIDRPGLPLALVEIKSSNQIDEHVIAPLAKLVKDLLPADAFCLSQDPIPKNIRGIQCLPWQMGLNELGLT